MKRKTPALCISLLVVIAAFFLAVHPMRAEHPAVPSKVKPIFLKDPSVQAKDQWAYKSGLLVAFAPDGQTLLSFHSPCPRICYWNLAKQKLVETIDLGRIPIDDPVISQDSRTLVFTGYKKLEARGCFPDRAINKIAWDGFDGMTGAFSLDSRTVGISDSLGSVSVVRRDNLDGILPGKTDMFRARGSGYACLTFSQDQRFLYAASGRHMYCFDLREKEIVRSISLEPGRQIWSISQSPDGKSLLVGCELYNENGGRISGGELEVWDRSLSKMIARKKAQTHTSGIARIVISPTKRFFATACRDGHVVLWNAKDFQQIDTFDPHLKGFRNMAISHDGKKMAACYWDGNIAVWETGVKDGKK